MNGQDDQRHFVTRLGFRIALAGDLEAGAETLLALFTIQARRDDLSRFFQRIALKPHHN